MSLGEDAIQAKALEEEGDFWEGLGFGTGVEHGSRDGLGKRPKIDDSTVSSASCAGGLGAQPRAR